MGTEIARRLQADIRIIGAPAEPIDGGWVEQLESATPNLRQLAQEFAKRLEEGERTILAMGRCAASIATLPLAGKRFPDAVVVWFDAHGDCNTAIEGCTTDKNYLGGMVLSGAAGEWDTGFGSGLKLANVILVGSRDLDPPEQARIDAGQIGVVAAGDRLGARLSEAIGERPIYIHLDCDVLDAGLVATEYQVPNGLSLFDLRGAFKGLAAHEVLGLEITEYEYDWPDGRPSRSDELIAAIWPVLTKLRGAPP